MHFIASECLDNGANSSIPEVQFYIDYVRSLPGERYIEQKVTVVKDKCWGTVDAFVIGDDGAHVVDFKFGTYPVPALQNPQLLCYALGIHRQFDVLPITLAIVQPRASAGMPIKTWRVSGSGLAKFALEMERAIAYDEGANAGEWCRFCKGKNLCEAYLLGGIAK